MDLNYHPTPDQRELAEAFENPLIELLPVARLHEASVESDDTWDALEGLGLFGIAAPEDRGGSGLGPAEEALIVQGLGRHLAAPAILATIAAAHAEPAVQARVAYGYRHDNRVVMIDDPAAELLLVRGADGADIYAKPRSNAALDARYWGVTLVEATGLDAPVAVLGPELLPRLRLLDAAALAGVAEAATAMGTAYAAMREQFGRPIGSQQAVKHHCANMAIAARQARDQTNFAAMALAEARDDAVLQIECALLVAMQAAAGNAALNIQIHGGIGFSDEADPHLLVKRAQLLTAIAGGTEAATERVAAIPAMLTA